jgi:hypothetical protein
LDLLVSAWKPRAAVLGLAALLAWPFAHYALVTRHHLSPWKYCGFAMYCVPNLPVSVELRVKNGDAWTQLSPATLPVDGQRLLASYCRERRLVGTLGAPTVVAGWLFRTRPALNELVVVVKHQILEPDTGRVGERTFEYPYVRPGSSAATDG